jgi:3-dehydroquinate synthase
MPSISVDLADRTYQVLVGAGLVDAAGERIVAAGLSGKCALVSDSTVGPLYAQRVATSLRAAGCEVSVHGFPAGEASKSMAQAETLCRGMIEAGHDRKSFLVALGGGVTGDLAGFVAAIFFRGIPFVQIPTTIVAQVDSSVGGKTGVNTPEGKNLLGAFHQPRLVLVDPETLRTLAPREFREGFAEAIKHAAIRDAAMLDELAALDPASQEVPAELIARNIAIKARIVEADEFETTGMRALLNFGHTIGHGIEAAVPYGSLLHGEAIALGMRAALWLSVDKAGLEAARAEQISALLDHFSLPVRLPATISTQVVLEKLGRDKKFSRGAIRFVLLRAAGDAFVSGEITAADLAAAVEQLR